MKHHYFEESPISRFKLLLMSLSDPLPWVIDKKGDSILDLGCGQGKPMAMIKLWRNIKNAVGVDLYKPYIKLAKKLKLHDKYIISDIRKIKFKPKSFDIVLASHIVEHLSKVDAWKLIKKMEKIAARQVVIATPIGEIYQPMFDDNKLQEHKSHFFPEEFEKRGYKTVRYGYRWILDEHSSGLVHKVQNPFFKKIIYLFNFVLTPFYYLFPNLCDYSFVAYKQVSNEK